MNRRPVPQRAEMLTRYTMPAEYESQHEDRAPVMLLHGFDSSSLEFRRLLPLLEQSLETWAVDLVGWGFSNSGAASHSDMKLGPKQKRDHLYAFWKEKVRFSMSPFCLCDLHCLISDAQP